VTIAKWLTPDGTSIQDNGITPDIEVELNEDGDTQLDEAIEEIKQAMKDVTDTSAYFCDCLW